MWFCCVFGEMCVSVMRILSNRSSLFLSLSFSCFVFVPFSLQTMLKIDGPTTAPRVLLNKLLIITFSLFFGSPLDYSIAIFLF